MDTLRRNIREFDFTLVGVLLLLAAYSVTALYAVAASGSSSGWMKQLFFEILGLILMIGASLVDYQSIRRLRWWLYGTAIILLVAVFAFPRVNGAHSWINLKVTTFQPSELAKLALILVMADYMAKVDESELPSYGLKHLLPLLGMMIVPFALILKEPALGQSLVVFAIFVTMYVMFTKRTYFILLTLGLVVLVSAIGFIAVQYPHPFINFVQTVAGKHHLLKPYQMARIRTWLDPSYSISNFGFNIHEARIAIGSGQVFGEGLLGGIVTNGGFVPNQSTDYIFTVIGEELGFVGSAVLVFLFLVLVYRLIRVAATSQDTFGTYYIVGMIGMIGFQVFENIGADMYLSPSTGITLPFISYGGSSLVINYLSMGIILSIALRRKKLRFN
ncbi:FtsW/RodA/SpoVE family cell cycle protein [Alicyclobacillus sp. SO9]|uniref:FtsW/RodA/SpoVE family cell cycle protein n=1 Tax=Alicyclobacillus sp. SO9 TaxID=2665646 RepID=UPI0018E7C0DC|nr:FtsW/RodA/SpoVE family cell cycle protein [Alicyclobacillus sp. SO9]QQE80370.1 rod shape-determining protein RodA [Alicyclobacillus sp. SO9]